MSSKFWIDNYGVVWQRLRNGLVWNRFTGCGLWDSGKGLTPYYGVHTDEAKRQLGLS